MSFKDFGLDKALLQSLEDLGINDPTPIQTEAIPLVLEKKDVAGLAQTGTGKTAAFLLPTIQRILASILDEPSSEAFENWGAQNFSLILVPTRELAEQVNKNISDFSCGGKIKSAVVIGGKDYDEQINKIAEGVDFIVATPGRLIDLYKEKKVDLNLAKSVIFDEADRMFDMGFKEDMVYLLQRVPSDRQLLMFSATLNFDVLNVAYEFGSEPIEVNIDRDQARAENVNDEIFHVGHDEKPKFLVSIFNKLQPSQGIIFSNFKRNIPKIEKFLIENGYKTQGISSSLNQNQRQRVMDKFKEGKVQILVATDVAARGLDVKGVDLVLNFELPEDPENYIHRIGRTGRAGEKGVAFSLVSDKDVPALNRIQNFLGNKLEVGWLEDEDLVKDFKPFDYRFDPNAKFDKVQKNSRNQRSNNSGPKNRSRKPKKNESKASGRSKDFSKTKKSAKSTKPNNEKSSESQQKKANSKTSNFKKKDFKKQNQNPKSKNKKTNRYKDFKTRKRSGSASTTQSQGVFASFKKWLGM